MYRPAGLRIPGPQVKTKHAQFVQAKVLDEQLAQLGEFLSVGVCTGHAKILAQT
jgi:hypothetical protein